VHKAPNARHHAGCDAEMMVYVACLWQLEMMLILSWEDNKIFARCANAGAGGFDPSDPCGLFWQPSLLWQNVLLHGSHSALPPTPFSALCPLD
jgi:hypothetical protein